MTASSPLLGGVFPPVLPGAAAPTLPTLPTGGFFTLVPGLVGPGRPTGAVDRAGAFAAVDWPRPT